MPAPFSEIPSYVLTPAGTLSLDKYLKAQPAFSTMMIYVSFDDLCLYPQLVEALSQASELRTLKLYFNFTNETGEAEADYEDCILRFDELFRTDTPTLSYLSIIYHVRVDSDEGNIFETRTVVYEHRPLDSMDFIPRFETDIISNYNYYSPPPRPISRTPREIRSGSHRLSTSPLQIMSYQPY